MSDPTRPNYKKNVGRLVTDRYDFEDHITGNKFRHNADQIDLNPIITVGGVPKRNVQQALQAISDITSPPTVADADSVTKGIIKLAGDVGGTANSVIVTGLQQKPVSTATPSLNDVLTWDGYSWTPSTATSAFSPGNDLSGSNILQSVVQITGNAGSLPVKAAEVIFDMNISPTIKQATEPAMGALGVHDLTIEAQSSNFAGSGGGSVVLKSGTGPTGSGNIISLVNGNVLVESGYVPSTTNRVVSLVRGSGVAPGDVPSGDLVVYIGNAASPPSSNPSAGAILYGDSGKLNIRQSDGVDFTIGTIPNPSIWGPVNAQVVSYRVTGQTIGAGPVDLLNYVMPTNTSVRIDVVIVGKEIGTFECEQMNLSHSLVWDNGTSSFILIDGIPLTKSDPKRSAIAGASWTDPDIIISGNSFILRSGFGTTETINWMAAVQIVILEAV